MVEIKLASFYIIFTLILGVILGYLIRYASENWGINYSIGTLSINTLKKWAYVAVAGFGILGVLGALLPFDWGKPLIDTTFLFLLVVILILEALVALPFFKPNGIAKPLVPIIECTESPDVGTAQGALNFITCLFTGYQFNESGENDNYEKNWLGITTFLVFYVILPFAFITALVWGLFNGVNLKPLFGKNERVASIVTKIMTVVVALYATREVMGGMLLQFFGVSVWGVAAIFIAGIITIFVRNVVVKFIGFQLEMKNVKDKIKERAKKTKEIVNTLSEQIKSAEGLIEEAPLKALGEYFEVIEVAKGYGIITDEKYNEIKEDLTEIKIMIEHDKSGDISSAKNKLRNISFALRALIKKKSLI